MYLLLDTVISLENVMIILGLELMFIILMILRKNRNISILEDNTTNVLS